MEEKTEALLRELAAKVGTTTEHLYSVLVKQAKVEIVKNVIYLALLIILIVVGIHFIGTVHYVAGKIVKTQYSVDMIYQDSNVPFIICWSCNAIFWIIALITGYGSVCSIITNSVNPEYEAVTTILSSLSPNE